MDGTAHRLATVRRTVVDHIATCLHSLQPQTVTAGLALAAALDAAGVSVDDDVDARLRGPLAAPVPPGRR
ncbi:hypothetical protein P3T36_006875 [Kitasatospora sp. MAP12-15]|uniref:hypothetical protein n=1 Tax=unclassified Kitasatospora TaxID=2633591 RepID=UPI002476D9C3|nr:hypothetical protein [Kitasatospora sp. MAP12-44]MDH6111942.1 hypothetical protein [Kitasatospora sp. MAP12-44]